MKWSTPAAVAFPDAILPFYLIWDNIIRIQHKIQQQKIWVVPKLNTDVFFIFLETCSSVR